MNDTEVISEGDKWRRAWQNRFPQPSVHRAYQPKAAMYIYIYTHEETTETDRPPQEKISISHSWGLDPLFSVWWMFLATKLVHLSAGGPVTNYLEKK